jgi:apolipoprotein N-acyltransferase
MTGKKWLLDGLYLVIATAAFSLSAFRLDSAIWIAAWIAPVFLIRFIRTSRWVPAVILGFVVLQLSLALGSWPLFGMMRDTMSTTLLRMDARFVLKWQAMSGFLFAAPLFLAPLLLDKALHRRLPKLAATLVYPAGVVVVELLSALTTGLARTYGETQFALPPLIAASSLLGVSGLSFLMAWTASMINRLWEENWSIKALGGPGLVYAGIAAALLIFGATTTAFPQKARGDVRIAGITAEFSLFDRLYGIDADVSGLLALNPAECARLMSSPQAHLDEMRQKTVDAAEAGASIIVWQETPLAMESSVADAYLEEMRTLADQRDIYLLVSYERILNEAEKRDRILRNMGVLFTPTGEVGWEYTKAFPVPGLEAQFSAAGPRSIPSLDTPYGRIGQIICADATMPRFMRQAGTKDIDILLNPSLDTAAHTPRFSLSSAIRAVENGFTMVRVTGDGLSTVIDPYFKQVAGQDSFQLGTPILYVDVPVVSHQTVYAAIGFLFPYAMALLLVALIVVAAVPRRRDRSAHTTNQT